jgi:hypothetical protein
LPFFFLAKEKGPKRTAPIGAGPVFPQITSRENTSNGGLLATRPLQRCVAGRNNAEKPPAPPPVARGIKLTSARTPLKKTAGRVSGGFRMYVYAAAIISAAASSATGWTFQR